MKTRFFTLAALALALVACNNDNENLNGDPVAAQFTANIAPATRASGTTWTAGDRIGITDIGYDSQYGNVPFILKNGKFEAEGKVILKSATKLFSVLLASKRPLITELADKLRLKYPLLPTISPCPTMRLEAIRSIIPISCRRYPKSV